MSFLLRPLEKMETQTQSAFMDTTSTKKNDIEIEDNIFSLSKKNDFNLETVSHHFRRCLQPNGQLDLKEYLSAYHELCRFFRLTGRLFGFVAKDIEGKIESIEHHMNSSHGKHYTSIQSMINYEVRKNIFDKKWPRASGCRTLLRLHWALEFILHFMQEIRDSEENAKASKIAWEVYSETLYHHHPWLTRKLASVAVYALPSKKHLIETMCHHNYEKVMVLLDEVLELGQPVYDSTQALLIEENITYIS